MTKMIADLPRKEALRRLCRFEDILAELKLISARIDAASGSPTFTSEEHDRIEALIARAEGRS